MASDSPFFLSKVECPICRTINEFETVRMGAYVEEGRDSDFCPRDIKWRYPKYDGYNPLVFFVATCGNCYYSREYTPAYKEWKKDNAFRTYRLKATKDKHLDQLATADSIVKRLGKAIDMARFPNQTAILKLHLAAFDEQLFEHYSRLDLGRFYLRIGWVFRSLEGGENPQISRMRGFLYELDTRHDGITDALGSARDRVAEFLESVQSQFEADTLTSELKAQILPYRERFLAEGAALTERITGVEQRLADLTTLIEEFKTVGVGLGDINSEPTFAGFPTFAEFLYDLKKSWDGIVTSEREALQKAVHFYRQAFTDGRSIAPGNQQIQASYLIAELSRRTGDFATAREFFNHTIRHGQEFIYRNRHDQTQTALARKILELAIEYGKSSMEAPQGA
ncbi:MAG TPA: DUF2225 domain-containing protein [candidate division Zixibacteria bacterium]|nr:DUF2225 domain-containing protein [candidate division Zixibacteria bacterium]MDD4916831.1 DUF2225 domain-containing protein [candidate division Zixibacteria bacterium]MDM7973573.1 DUF2225 domain-containing protein [candidate division Zixibacteria bacterium]HOD65167.1 DUF2225 domain-containing protein [candidate division Zixibacteria bacterium]HOZ07361.1 DUF2225 domain-containing protein [candidate division Zixibacteria bacterium]